MKKFLIGGSIAAGALLFIYFLYRLFFTGTVAPPIIPSDTPPPPPPSDVPPCVPYTQEQKNADAQACADSNCTGLSPSELGGCLGDCISSTPPIKIC